MEIKKAESVDIPLLAEMNHRLIEDEGHSNPMGVLELQERMRIWIQKEYEAWLAVAEGKVIGYCLFRKSSEGVYVRQFFIEREERRGGKGRAFFSALEKGVWKREKEIRLEVLTANSRGIGFWKFMGFAEYCITMQKIRAPAPEL